MSTKVEIQKKIKVIISDLSQDVGQIYIPYIHGALKSYCEEISVLKQAVEWSRPIYDCRDYKKLLDSIERPDILGISCYVWNIQSQIWLAEQVKLAFPNCLIVAGGPSVPDMSEVFLRENPFIDIAVHGEGEVTFSQILLYELGQCPDLESICGLSFIDRYQQYIKTPKRSRLKSLKHLRNAYDFPELIEVIHEVKKNGYSTGAILETNRGCPFGCVFCDWGSATNSKIKTFSRSKVFSEIDFFSDLKIDHVFCADANFGIFQDDLETADYLVEKKAATGHPRLFTFNAAKKSTTRIFEISQKLSQENMSLIGTTFSPQSLSEVALEIAGRKNIPAQLFADGISAHNDFGLPIYSEVLVGLPGETRESFQRGITELLDLGVHNNIRVYPLILLPNAPMSSPEYLLKHKIKTIKAKVWLEHCPPVPEREELVDLVIYNSTMNPNDWVFQMSFGTMVQAFHCAGWTNYLSEYLSQSKQVGYFDFYTRLSKHLEQDLGPMGDFYREIVSIYKGIIDSPPQNYFGWSSYSVNFNGKIEKLKSFPYVRLWMKMILNQKLIFKELKEFLRTLDLSQTSLASKILDFQKETLYSPEVPIDDEKLFVSSYDFVSFFTKKSKIIEEGTFRIRLKPRSRNNLEKVFNSTYSAKNFLTAATGGGNVVARQFSYDISNSQIESL